MIDLNFKYKKLLTFLKKQFKQKPIIGIVLGSGLGDFASELNLIRSIPTNQIPGYPASTVEGHAGKLHLAEFDGKIILLFQGRIHFYEGYPLSECILPAYISYKLGCTHMLLTNAAGGVNEKFNPGDFMLAESLNGMAIKQEITTLFGIVSAEVKNSFLDFPSESFNTVIKEAAAKTKINLMGGVYWFSKGPVYETPAEVRFAKKFGADAVGMSTVHEAVAAAYFGLKVSSISCITNLAAGISSTKLSHKEVTETADLVRSDFGKLVKDIIRLL